MNSDLNGSANIGRKVIPDMYDFGDKPNFSNVVVIKHPDYDNRTANREKIVYLYQGIRNCTQNVLTE